LEQEVADYSDPGAAQRALEDPRLSGDELADIAEKHHSLWPQVAAHPSLYPGLMNWLEQYGDEPVKAAIASRRAGAAGAAPASSPPPPPDSDKTIPRTDLGQLRAPQRAIVEPAANQEPASPTRAVSPATAAAQAEPYQPGPSAPPPYQPGPSTPPPYQPGPSAASGYPPAPFAPQPYPHPGSADSPGHGNAASQQLSRKSGISWLALGVLACLGIFVSDVLNTLVYYVVPNALLPSYPESFELVMALLAGVFLGIDLLIIGVVFLLAARPMSQKLIALVPAAVLLLTDLVVRFFWNEVFAYDPEDAASYYMIQAGPIEIAWSSFWASIFTVGLAVAYWFVLRGRRPIAYLALVAVPIVSFEGLALASLIDEVFSSIALINAVCWTTLTTLLPLAVATWVGYFLNGGDAKQPVAQELR
jgi:hypothetical protein